MGPPAASAGAASCHVGGSTKGALGAGEGAARPTVHTYSISPICTEGPPPAPLTPQHGARLHGLWASWSLEPLSTASCRCWADTCRRDEGDRSMGMPAPRRDAGSRDPGLSPPARGAGRTVLSREGGAGGTGKGWALWGARGSQQCRAHLWVSGRPLSSQCPPTWPSGSTVGHVRRPEGGNPSGGPSCPSAS